MRLRQHAVFAKVFLREVFCYPFVRSKIIAWEDGTVTVQRGDDITEDVATSADCPACRVAQAQLAVVRRIIEAANAAPSYSILNISALALAAAMAKAADQAARE